MALFTARIGVDSIHSILGMLLSLGCQFVQTALARYF